MGPQRDLVKGSFIERLFRIKDPNESPYIYFFLQKMWVETLIVYLVIFTNNSLIYLF